MSNPTPPPTLDLKRIGELIEMEKKATNAPWWLLGDWAKHTNNNHLIFRFECPYADVPQKWEANKELVIALRNAAPALLRAARDAAAMREALEKIVKKEEENYGPGCGYTHAYYTARAALNGEL